MEESMVSEYILNTHQVQSILHASSLHPPNIQNISPFHGCCASMLCFGGSMPSAAICPSQC